MRVPSIHVRYNAIPEGSVDYIKNPNSKNGLTVLFYNIVLPPIRNDISCGHLTPLEVLEERIQRVIIIRIKSEYLDLVAD